jgi:hypothetical protein
MAMSVENSIAIIRETADKAEARKEQAHEFSGAMRLLIHAMETEQIDSLFITERNEITNANTLAIIEKQGEFFEPQLTSLPDKMPRIY